MHSNLMMLMAISNGITAISYASIPIVLIVILNKRKDIPFSWVIFLFIAFILACGATHVMHIIGLWTPVDGAQAFVDTFCALISVVTAITLWPYLPRFLHFPSPAQLREVNRELRNEKAALEQAQNELRRAYADVELRVRERTVDLASANEALQAEIHERIRAEEHIREKTDELDRIFTLSLDLLCITNLEGELLKINPVWEQTLGYPLAELEGQNFLGFIHPDDMPATLQAIGTLTAGQEVLDFTNRYRCKDGSYRWIEWRSKPYQQSLIYAAARDITERKQAEEEIQELNATLEQHVQERTTQLLVANQELESFSYSVSHDLRAPLRSIDGFSQAFIEDYADRLDDKALDYLNRIRSATQRMSQLIDDLLRLSRISRSEMTISDVDLCELVRETMYTLESAQPERLVEVSMPARLVVRADARLMSIAIENLLRNAWKFTRNNAQARIELGQLDQNDKGIIYIRDNGSGFDMQYADKLFRPFERLHSPGDFEGSGIGLAIVSRIILRHGGQVWAEGKMGKGATFYFTL